MGDHILVVESGQSDARGLAVMAAAKQAIPNKPIRFVVNSHPHFDHASGLAAAVAEGATILTHRNNEPVLERLLAGPRTLTGDSLSKVTNRRTNVVEGVGDRDVRKGSNGKVVELHRMPNEHSDGMLVVYLPAEKVLWSADITGVNPNPAQLAVAEGGRADRQPGEARLQQLASGAPAEPGQAAHEGGRAGRGGSGNELILIGLGLWASSVRGPAQGLPAAVAVFGAGPGLHATPMKQRLDGGVHIGGDGVAVAAGVEAQPARRPRPGAGSSRARGPAARGRAGTCRDRRSCARPTPAARDVEEHRAGRAAAGSAGCPVSH